MIRYLMNADLSGPEMVIYGAMLMIVLIYSLSIHEFMHGYSAFRLGDDTAKLQGRLTMNPLVHLHPLGTVMMLLVGFGWAKPVPVNYAKLTRLKNRKNSIRIVSVAGVTANFLSAWVAYALLGITTVIFDSFLVSGTSSEVFYIFRLISELLGFFFYFNLMLMAFNLLPLPPLDGFHIVETLIPVKYKEQFHQVERYFSFALLGLIIYGMVTGFSPLFWLIEKIRVPFEYVITTPIDWLVLLFVK